MPRQTEELQERFSQNEAGWKTPAGMRLSPAMYTTFTSIASGVGGSVMVISAKWQLSSLARVMCLYDSKPISGHGIPDQTEKSLKDVHMNRHMSVAEPFSCVSPPDHSPSRVSLTCVMLLRLLLSTFVTDLVKQLTVFTAQQWHTSSNLFSTR